MNVLKTVLRFLWEHVSMVLIAVIILLVVHTSRLTSRNNYLGASVERQATTFKEWADSMGRSHGRLQAQTVYLTQLTESDRARVEDAAKTVKVRPEHVNNLTQVTAVTQGHFKASLDTVGDFMYIDSNLTISAKEDTSMGLKTLVGDYTYRDIGTIVSYDTAKRFLGIKYRTDEYIDVHFNNPNTKIAGLTNISLKPYTRPKHFAIGPVVGITYIDHWRPYVGFGITYSLIRF
jgi:hypothetical protein